MPRCSRRCDVTDVDAQNGQFFPPGPVGPRPHADSLDRGWSHQTSMNWATFKLWNWAMRPFSDAVKGRHLVAEGITAISITGSILITDQL